MAVDWLVLCLLVATDEGAAVHRIIPLSLSFDHRAVSGGEATRFLAAVIASRDPVADALTI